MKTNPGLPNYKPDWNGFYFAIACLLFPLAVALVVFAFIALA